MQITIVGCGNMGTGLAQCLSQHYKLCFFDRNPEKAARLEKQGFGKAVSSLPEALKQSEAVFLAVKPQQLVDAAGLICSATNGKTPFLLSLLAGTAIASLKQHFPHFKVVRIMPNLAMIHGEGLVAVTTDEELSVKERDQLAKLLGYLGKMYWLPENKIDAFTSLASSGLAFAFVLIEAMVDAGIAMGFNAKEAQEIVQQMLKGSLALCEKTGKHPADLKWQVTSPAGTTIAGLRKLEQAGLRAAVIDTFFAAYQRAKEL